MPWAGGSFTRLNGDTGWVDDASLGIGIEAGEHDLVDTDFKNGINQCLTKDGQNAATADLPMGAFKHTNVANATARNNYAAVGQVQDGDFIWLGTTGGTATAQTATASPAITAYKAGQKFRMKIGVGLGSTGSTNTTHTLNINSLGAQQILDINGSLPTLGTWVAARIMELVYDGTYFFITNDPGGWLTYTPPFSPLTGSASSVVASGAYYKIGANINLIVKISWTQNTSNTLYVAFDFPVSANQLDQFFTAGCAPTGGVTISGVSFNANTTTCRVYVYDGATNFTVGANRVIYVQGVYRSV